MNLEKVKRLPWKKISPIVILLITIALNIWLGCMPVFKGSAYIGDTKNWHYKISFDGNTFDWDYEHKTNTATTSSGKVKVFGFYYIDDGVNLYAWSSDGSNSGRKHFKRNSVFSMTAFEYSGDYFDKQEEIICTNTGAVCLQIFYAAVMLVCCYRILFCSHFKEQKIEKNDDIVKE